jgi:hypothetical protein
VNITTLRTTFQLPVLGAFRLGLPDKARSNNVLPDDINEKRCEHFLMTGA